MSSGLDRLMNVSADRVFAEPVRIGDRVVIPAASVEFSGGFGFGGDSQSNGGGGGGGYQAGRPVAIIEAGPDGVRVKPVIDFTRVGLTLVAAALTVWRASRAIGRSRVVGATCRGARARRAGRPRSGSGCASRRGAGSRPRRGCSSPGSSGPISSAGMPPNASANGPTNGIDPPTPISTGSTPKPACSARRAASNAGPVGSVCHAGAPSSGVNVHSRPHGTFRSTCARRPREHPLGFLARTEPQADARRRPGDDLVRRSLDRMTVDPDDREARPQPQPFVQRDRRDHRRAARPAARRTHGRTARARRRSPRSAPAPSAPARAARRSRPSNATSPCSSTSDASSRDNAMTGSGIAPPDMPECCGPSSARSSMSAAARPRNE